MALWEGEMNIKELLLTSSPLCLKLNRMYYIAVSSLLADNFAKTLSGKWFDWLFLSSLLEKYTGLYSAEDGSNMTFVSE